MNLKNYEITKKKENFTWKTLRKIKLNYYKKNKTILYPLKSQRRAKQSYKKAIKYLTYKYIQ